MSSSSPSQTHLLPTNTSNMLETNTTLPPSSLSPEFIVKALQFICFPGQLRPPSASVRTLHWEMAPELVRCPTQPHSLGQSTNTSQTLRGAPVTCEVRTSVF